MPKSRSDIPTLFDVLDTSGLDRAPTAPPGRLAASIAAVRSIRAEIRSLTVELRALRTRAPTESRTGYDVHGDSPDEGSAH